MSQAVKWITSMDEAMKSAKAQDAPILLDFFNPG